MKNLNLSPFYVGQRIVYITGYCLPKNSIHQIKRMFQFPCGCYGLDIGLNDPYNPISHIPETHCCPEHETRIPYQGIDLFDSKSFRPIQEAAAPLITLSKVIEEQPVIAN